MTSSPQPVGPHSAKYALMTQRAQELAKIQQTLIGQVAADAIRETLEWCAVQVESIGNPEGESNYADDLLRKIVEGFRLAALGVKDPETGEPPPQDTREIRL